MSSIPSVRRSAPSINRAAYFQRLQFRQIHTSTSLPSSSPPTSASSFDSNPREASALGNFLRWVSAVAAGSGLGLLCWSSSDYSSALFNDKSLLSFGDLSSASVVDWGRRSRTLFRKLSLPETSPKFLFGGTFNDFGSGFGPEKKKKKKGKRNGRYS